MPRIHQDMRLSQHCCLDLFRKATQCISITSVKQWNRNCSNTYGATKSIIRQVFPPLFRYYIFSDYKKYRPILIFYQYISHIFVSLYVNIFIFFCCFSSTNSANWVERFHHSETMKFRIHGNNRMTFQNKIGSCVNNVMKLQLDWGS